MKVIRKAKRVIDSFKEADEIKATCLAVLSLMAMMHALKLKDIPIFQRQYYPHFP